MVEHIVKAGIWDEDRIVDKVFRNFRNKIPVLPLKARYFTSDLWSIYVDQHRFCYFLSRLVCPVFSESYLRQDSCHL